MAYLFGDSDRALQRLEVLARVFRPPTEAFLVEHRDRHPLGADPVILDLGCGPGRTTRLLADVFGASVTGLDSSEALLWEARRLGPKRVQFRHYDVARGRLPDPRQDLVFCRLLLSHLPDPAKRVADWCRTLRSGGCLLVEEVEDIVLENDVFERYLGLVSQALKRQGGRLYVGGELGGLGDNPAASVVSNRVQSQPVSDVDAARMFSLNLPTLAQTDEVRALADPETLDNLQADLDEIAYSDSRTSSITWHTRRVAWRSNGGS